jgi:hypothetical protein
VPVPRARFEGAGRRRTRGRPDASARRSTNRPQPDPSRLSACAPAPPGAEVGAAASAAPSSAGLAQPVNCGRTVRAPHRRVLACRVRGDAPLRKVTRADTAPTGSDTVTLRWPAGTTTLATRRPSTENAMRLIGEPLTVPRARRAPQPETRRRAVPRATRAPLTACDGAATAAPRCRRGGVRDRGQAHRRGVDGIVRRGLSTGGLCTGGLSAGGLSTGEVVHRILGVRDGADQRFVRGELDGRGRAGRAIRVRCSITAGCSRSVNSC